LRGTRIGETPFVASYQSLKDSISRLPSQRNLGFLCDFFKLPPSDPRLWEMTEEQLQDLYMQIAHRYPSEKTTERYEDDDYEEFEREVLGEAPDEWEEM
jgi:hypothetical protein